MEIVLLMFVTTMNVKLKLIVLIKQMDIVMLNLIVNIMNVHKTLNVPIHFMVHVNLTYVNTHNVKKTLIVRLQLMEFVLMEIVHMKIVAKTLIVPINFMDLVLLLLVITQNVT
jgi:hypothetical protein